MAEIVPELYEKWLEGGKKWLDGKSPCEYFEQINDMQIYLSMLIEYIRQDKKPPEPLLDCIADSAETEYNALVNILKIDEADEITESELSDVKAQIVQILSEAGAETPEALYVDMLLNMQEECELGEEIVLALKNGADEGAILNAFRRSEGYARMCFADILSEYVGSARAADAIIEEFQHSEENTAFLADCLGKLGDERAIPYLEDAMKDSELDYFVYTAIKNAVEQIKGEEIADADFSGDELYELLKNMED